MRLSNAASSRPVSSQVQRSLHTLIKINIRAAAFYGPNLLLRLGPTRQRQPGDLLVWRPTKFELVINLRGTGAKIQPKVLATADEVIE